MACSTPDDDQLAFPAARPTSPAACSTCSSTIEVTAAVVNLVEDPENAVNGDLQELAPTVHFAVPRVWEKQFSTIAIKLKEGDRESAAWAYRKAIACRREAQRPRNSKASKPVALPRGDG